MPRAQDPCRTPRLAYRFQHHSRAGPTSAWLLRILTNNFINHYRRSTRERRVLDSDDSAPVGDGVMSRAAMRGLTDATAVAQEGLLRGEIFAALDSLPEDYRVMIVLADIEELSYKEIAEAVEVPIGTVMSRLHRARKLMQKQLIEQAVQMGIVKEPEAELRTPRWTSKPTASASRGSHDELRYRRALRRRRAGPRGRREHAAHRRAARLRVLRLP